MRLNFLYQCSIYDYYCRNMWYSKGTQVAPFTKNPGNLAVPGHLTLQYDTHEVYTKIYNYYLSIIDYSMIEATRPDPTVRPPSRI